MRLVLVLLLAQRILAQTVAVTDCTLVDPRTGVAAAHRTVVIRGERIAAVGPAASTRIPPGARVVRGTGKFVIPGLWDMHVHVGEIEEDWFPLYLANGLTGLREMAASETNIPRQKQYQQDQAAGRRTGPELWWTHSSMDTFSGSREARAEVARRAAAGTRYVKVYNGLSREAYFAIADECRKRGLQMVGHIPDAVSAREVGRAGQASVEHLDGVLLACSRKENEARWTIQHNGPPQWKLLLDTFDSAKADLLIESFREGGVWQTPTLTIHRVQRMALEGKLPGDARVEYARKDYLKGWQREAREIIPGMDAVSARRVLALYQDLLRRMQKAGVRILAGTDTPVAYVMPGFALHDELGLLVEAGLTPAEALRTATWNPAEFLKQTTDFGSVEVGKMADLVVLDANPLVAIGNTRRISAVVRRGRVTDAAALLAGVRKATGR